MSAANPSRTGKPLIDRLPDGVRDELIGIGRDALRRFSYSYQEVFDDHLEMFDLLIEFGATASMIGQMLGEVGIVRKDGAP
jgi:hypothetical protein